MRISDWSSDVCSSDLDEFLSSRKSHDGKVVVHGHTIMLEVDEHPNRIGIDTGAYHSGRLTAICLQGTERWYLAMGMIGRASCRKRVCQYVSISVGSLSYKKKLNNYIINVVENI